MQIAPIAQQGQYIPNIKPHETAHRMMQIALAEVHKVEVVNFARYAVRWLIDERTNITLAQLSEIKAIHHLVQQTVRYGRDPIGVEAVYHPQTIIQLVKMYSRWSEDCDSIALLTLTLLLALGQQVRLTIAGFHGQTYSHVFCESYVKNIGWLAVDPSLGDDVHQMCASITLMDHIYPS